MKKWLGRILLSLSLLIVPLIIFYYSVVFTHGKYSGLLALIFTAIIVGGWVWLLSRRRNRTRKYIGFLAGVALIPLAFCTYLCIPFAPRTLPSEQVYEAAKTQFWNLETGSKIAYYHLPVSTGQKEKGTILFLHGGPGGSVTLDNVEFFQQFTELGYDVYLYDQAGSGRSGFLPVNEYNQHRNVQDLSEIIQTINAENLTVVGHSYGGVLLADALANKEISPKISKAVFSEPGPFSINYNELQQYVDGEIPAKSDYINPRKQVQKLPWALYSPRMWLAVMLLTPDNEFVPQEEMANILEPADMEYYGSKTQCPDDNSNKSHEGKDTGMRLNIFATININSKPADFAIDNLAQATAPAMLLLGECTFVERRDQLAYIAAYPNMERVHYFEGYGHSTLRHFPDQRQNLPFESIVAFLEDRPAPLPNYPTRDDFPEFVKEDK